MSDPTKVNLVAWWEFETQSFLDSHTNDLDLTESGSVLNTTGGINSNYANFQSGTNYLYHADDALLSFGSGDAFCILGWYRMHTRTSDYEVLGKWATSNFEYRIWYDYLPGKELKWELSSNGTSAAGTAESNVSMSQGTWYFFYAYYDGAGTFGIEVDDSGTGTTASGDPADRNSALFLGDTFSGAGNPLNGGLDAVAIFDRELTAAEQTWMYNSGSGRKYTDLADTADVSRRFLDRRAYRRARRIREAGGFRDMTDLSFP